MPWSCLSGLLRLCAPRRCQSGVLHDPGTHISHELVVDILPHQPMQQTTPERRPTDDDCDHDSTTIKMRTALSLSWRIVPVKGTASSQTKDWTVITKRSEAWVRVFVCFLGSPGEMCSDSRNPHRTPGFSHPASLLPQPLRGSVAP